MHNPYARECNSGGSSSGSGALIAKADVDMAIRADQGGSIRVVLISSMCYLASKLLLTSLIALLGGVESMVSSQHLAWFPTRVANREFT